MYAVPTFIFLSLFFICAGGWSSARSRRALDDTSRALSPLSTVIIRSYYKEPLVILGWPMVYLLEETVIWPTNRRCVCVRWDGRGRGSRLGHEERERESSSDLNQYSTLHARRTPALLALLLPTPMSSCVFSSSADRFISRGGCFVIMELLLRLLGSARLISN